MMEQSHHRKARQCHGWCKLRIVGSILVVVASAATFVLWHSNVSRNFMFATTASISESDIHQRSLKAQSTLDQSVAAPDDPPNATSFPGNRKHAQSHKWHVFVLASSALQPLLLNWWQSLSPFVTPDQHSVTVIALSPNLCTEIAPHLDSDAVRCEYFSNLESDIGDTVTFHDPVYLRNVHKKLDGMGRYFKNVPHGDMVMLSDADVVFLTSPFAYKFSESIDMWFSDNEINCGMSGKRVNTGLYFARSSRKTKRLFTDAVVALKEGNSYDNTDQGAIQHVLDHSSGLKFALLPCEQFANGNVYWGGKANTSNVVAVHANWIINSGTKLECLQKSGLWFEEGQHTLQPRSVDAMLDARGVMVKRCSARQIT